MSKSISLLRQWRERNGLSLVKAAEQFRVRDTTLMRWEQGEIPVDRVRLIADVTGIPDYRLRPDHFRAPTVQYEETVA